MFFFWIIGRKKSKKKKKNIFVKRLICTIKCNNEIRRVVGFDNVWTAGA
jgi:hypothetical protein